MPNRKIKIPSKKWFIQKYLNEKIGVYEIAKELNCSVNTIYRGIKEYNIFLPHYKSVSGERHPNWKGGRNKNNGYIRVYRPEHPNSDTHNTVYEHRLVMEKKLGRYLTKDEVVHHLNGVKDDNREENLMIMNNKSHGEKEMSLKKEMQSKILELEKIIEEINVKKRQ